MTREQEKNPDFNTLSVSDLRRRAAELGIVGRSRMNRAMLLNALETARDGSPSEDGRAPSFSDCAPPAEPTAPPYLDRGKPIPDTYSDDKVSLMIKDARSGYVYWELSGPVTERFRLAYGEDFLQTEKWHLRICSLQSRNARDIPIDVASYRWYVDLEPGRLFQIHLGFFDDEGSFITVLTSTPKTTPVETVSSILDETWPIGSTEVEEINAKARSDVAADSSLSWQARFQAITEQSLAVGEE
jgi:hypothetical protein